MIQVYQTKAELSASDQYMFDRLFRTVTLDHARAYVTASSYDELDYFSGLVGNLEIRYNKEDFTPQDCPFWYGVVCW
jgi:hypothetical protein